MGNASNASSIETAISLFKEKQSSSFQQWQTDKPTVLILGRSGSGKSTLINTIFGEKVAQAGTGRPVTQTYQFYSNEQTLINLYDTRGWEGGKNDEETFLAQTQELLQTSDTPPDIVWYVVEGAGARFTQYDRTVISTVLGELDVIVVITKSDIAHNEQIEQLKSTIERANLHNVRAVVPVAAAPMKGRSSRRSQRSIRQRFTNKFFKKPPPGIDDLIQTTTVLLPESRQRIFVAAQRADMDQKAVQVRNHILMTTMKAASVSVVGQFIPISSLNLDDLVETQLNMLGEIANMYDIGMDLSHTVGAFVIDTLTTAVDESLVFRAIDNIGNTNQIANATVKGSVAAVLTLTIGFTFRSLYHAIFEHGLQGKLDQIDNDWIKEFLKQTAEKVAIDLDTKKLEEYDFNV